jgi:mycothiol synthase
MARSFTEKLGFESVRKVIQMRRSLFSPIQPFVLPEKYNIRNFNSKSDIEIFLKLNKESFVELPDQASWSRKDFELRMAENWFSETGFALLENESKKVIGFCWTKVHGQDHKHEKDDGHQHLSHGHEPIGELYVLGVHPSEQGKGLGKTLLLWGLNHLRRNGLDSAMLYVDSNNQKAIKLYEEVGFNFWGLDRLYRSFT